ncbi:MAG: carbohydrate ABC transporter permease [Clostridia bacterium]|nr:carbohydrate ABC transporter permease [Clostridia bacterium]
MRTSSGARRHIRSLGGNILIGVILALVGAFLALPLVYAVVTAIKPIDELFIFPPRFFVRNPTLDNFTDLIDLCANGRIPFTKYLFNSIFISVCYTVLQVFFSSAAAYPLAKIDFPGRELYFKVIVTSLLFTTTVTQLPIYIILSEMGLVDSYWAMILPPLGGTMSVFLMKQFMEQIPGAIIEAARIDGCNEFKVFFKIIIPNVKPAWLTLIIFAFQAIWNAQSGILIFREDLRPLPTMISQIVTGNGIARAGAGSAATVFLMIPPIVLFILTQSGVMETMANAAIKE